MAVTGQGRRGRPAAATREQVIERTLAALREGRRVDVSSIAEELGLARGTIYRWFGSREALVAQVLVMVSQTVLARFRAEVGGEGGAALVETLHRFNGQLSRSHILASLLANEREAALGLICASDGPVTTGIAGAIAELIQVEVDRGAYVAPLEPALLAHAIVKVGEAFLFNHGNVSVRGDVARTYQVLAALVFAPPPAEA